VDLRTRRLSTVNYRCYFVSCGFGAIAKSECYVASRYCNREPLKRFGADGIPQLINRGQEKIMHVYLKHLSVL
jgi:hypothetical protein